MWWPFIGYAFNSVFRASYKVPMDLLSADELISTVRKVRMSTEAAKSNKEARLSDNLVQRPAVDHI